MEAIITHRNTDFDAFACLFAAARLYPSAVPVVPKALNINVKRFFSIHKDHLRFERMDRISPHEITRLIVVDACTWDRLEWPEDLEQGARPEVHVWDHHTEGDIRAAWSCKRPVGAAVTLLVDELRRRGTDLSRIEATLFAAGIYEDTGNLTFPSTTAEDARATAFLLEQGADLNLIRSILRPVYGPRQKDILSEMLKNERRVRTNGYDVAFNTIPIEGHTPGLSLVMDMYQEITHANTVFGIFQETRRNQCILIGRSSDESLDIGAVMRRMGGGGHPSAGSALLKGMTPETIEQWCRGLLVSHNRAPVKISDLMSSPVLTVFPETTMREAAMLFREKGCTGFPVLDDRKMLGMITRRDFRKVPRSDRMDRPVKAFMTSKVIEIDPESSVGHAAALLIKHDIGRLPVLDRDELIGIVTRSDIMRHYYHLLPD